MYGIHTLPLPNKKNKNKTKKTSTSILLYLDRECMEFIPYLSINLASTYLISTTCTSPLPKPKNKKTKTKQKNTSTSILIYQDGSVLNNFPNYIVKFLITYGSFKAYNTLSCIDNRVIIVIVYFFSYYFFRYIKAYITLYCIDNRVLVIIIIKLYSVCTYVRTYAYILSQSFFLFIFLLYI